MDENERKDFDSEETENISAEEVREEGIDKFAEKESPSVSVPNKKPNLVPIISAIVAAVAVITVVLIVLLGGQNDNNGDTHTHNFGNWTITKNATCKDEGEETRSCECGETETRKIDKINTHTEVVDPAVESTCKTNGKTEGKHCSVCDKIIVAQTDTPLKEHTPTTVDGYDSTCKQTGITASKKCSVCDAELEKGDVIPLKSHKYTDKYDESCNECGFIRDAECAHLNTSVIPGQAATCTKGGITDGTKCNKCGEILVAQTTIKATGHTEVIDAAVAATCTTDGKTEGKHCSVCSETLIAQNNIPASHTDGEWITDKEANCTEDGSKHQVCSVCNATIKTETIAATGHSIDVITCPPTCIQVGYDEYQCKKCDYSETKQWDEMSCSVSLNYIGTAYLAQGYCYAYTLTVNIIGGGSENFDADAVVVIHDIYGSNISTIYPAAYIDYDGSWSTSQTIYLLADWYHTIFVNIDTTTGYGFTCYYDVSSGTYRYDYDSLHKYDSVVTEPTKTEDGYTTHTCTVCGDSYVDTYTDAIGSAGLSYIINDDGTTCTITGIGTCEDEDIYIPAYIDGYKVTTIGEKVFENLVHIKSIHISKTVTDIANKAFYKCISITEIRIPETVVRIGSHIFLGCEALTTVYYDSSYAPPEGGTFIKSESIKKIVFGEKLTTIPNYICYNCDNLEEIILSPNTKYIGNYAFYYCKSVEKIELPNGLINTGWYAFYEMNITEIIIPDTVESIYNSFRGCRMLEKIVLPVSVLSAPSQTFYLCYSIKEVYYTGDELEWSAVSISEESSILKEATVYFYAETHPTDSGNYWHYIDGVPTPW